MCFANLVNFFDINKTGKINNENYCGHDLHQNMYFP